MQKDTNVQALFAMNRNVPCMGEQGTESIPFYACMDGFLVAFSFLFFFALRCLVGYLEAGGMADRSVAWGGQTSNTFIIIIIIIM